MRQVAGRDAEHDLARPWQTPDIGDAIGLAEKVRAGPAVDETVLGGDDEPAACDRLQHLGIGRADHPGVEDVGLDAVAEELLGRREHGAGHLADADEDDLSRARAQPARLEPGPGLGDRPRRGRLRVPEQRRPGELDRFGEHGGDLGRLGGAKDRAAGYLQGLHEVVDAMVARPVVAGHAGPAGDDRHRQAVEPDIEIPLVYGPREEGRVDGDHRPETAHGHARGRDESVLLGDADVHEALGVVVLEGQEPGRTWHGGCDRDYPLVGGGEID